MKHNKSVVFLLLIASFINPGCWILNPEAVESYWPIPIFETGTGTGTGTETGTNVVGTGPFGTTAVDLNGETDPVGTEETNLGNLLADASLNTARSVEIGVVASIHSAASVAASMLTGDIYQDEIEASFPNNQGLVSLTVTAQQLKDVLEHALSEADTTSGKFPQVAGLHLSFDPTQAAGSRIQTLTIRDENAAIADLVVDAGAVAGDAARILRIVTTANLADGGEGYPFSGYSNTHRINLTELGMADGGAIFADAGTEQDSFAEYMLENYTNMGYDHADLNTAADERIQNLSSRSLDTAKYVSIHHIQGAGHRSPFEDETVEFIAMVTIVKDTGSNKYVWLQEVYPDGSDRTSEGIYAYRPTADTLTSGDIVAVTGSIIEYLQLSFGEDSGNLTLTEIASGATMTILSNGNTLPDPVVVGVSGREHPNAFDDGTNGNVETEGTFDPTTNIIDYWESLEGMLIQVNDGQVVGSADKNGEITVLPDGGADPGMRTSRGGVLVTNDSFNPRRIRIDDFVNTSEPDVLIGDVFTGPIVGVLQYDYGNFRIYNDADMPAFTSGGLAPEITTLTGDSTHLTVATFNVENLDPGDGTQFDELAAIVVTYLACPDIIGVQEIQDDSGSTDDGTVTANTTYTMLAAAIDTAGGCGTTYSFTDIAPDDKMDGGQPGGNIRVGLLYNGSRVSLTAGSSGAGGATDASIPEAGPTLSYSPGRVDPTNTAFDDSRKSLVAEFAFGAHPVFVVVNHFNSKSGDSALTGRFQPPVFDSETQRGEMGTAVNSFVQSLLTLDANANVIVLGDFNDFEFRPPIVTLKGSELTDLAESLLAENERYTYVYGGNSQALDHILVTDNLLNNAAAEVDIVHVNAEFSKSTAHRASDHDPIVSRYSLP